MVCWMTPSAKATRKALTPPSFRDCSPAIPPSEDLAALADLVGPRRLGVDDWSGINMMCSDCSHGSPGSGHTHAPTKPGSHSLGLAGDEAALTDCLDQWIETSGSDLHLDRLELIW